MAVEAKEKAEELVSDNTSFEDAWDEDPEEAGKPEVEEEPSDETGEPEGGAEEEPTPVEAEEDSEEGEVKAPVPEKGKEVKPKAEPEEDLEMVRHKYKTVSGMYDSELQRRKELEFELESLKKGKPAESKEPVKEEPKEVTPDISKDLVGKISNLDSVKLVSEEHGEEVGKAIIDAASVIAAEMVSTMNKTIDGKIGEVSSAINPLKETLANSEVEKHFNTILNAHPDYYDYLESGELKLFVQSQTGTKKRIYEEIYNEGTAQELVDMVREFRESKGYIDEPVKDQGDTEDEATKAELEKMEAVESKKSPVSGAKGRKSKEDFEGAWDEA